MGFICFLLGGFGVFSASVFNMPSETVRIVTLTIGSIFVIIGILIALVADDDE